MANAVKHAARSRRSFRNDKNFRQFMWNAHRTAEEKAKVNFGKLLAEEMQKQREKEEATEEKKENE